MTTQITIHRKDRLFNEFMLVANRFNDEEDIERFDFWFDYFIKHETYYATPKSYSYKKTENEYIVYVNGNLLYTLKRMP